MVGSSPEDWEHRYGDDDLSGVVLKLKRRQGAKYNAALVNHIHTRAFLEAGMRLVQTEFAEAPPASETFPSFDRLRRKDLIVEAIKDDPELTEGRFRSRWEFLPDYLSDLIRYALRSARWSPHFSLLEKYSPLVESADLADAAHEIAFQDLDLVRRNSTAMRLQFVITAFAMRDRSNADALSTAYVSVLDKWRSFYEKIISSRGLTLRSGMSVDDLTAILHAAMEGFSLRLLGDPAAAIVDDERHRTLLGTVAVAMMAGCIDPGDGLSLDEFVRRLY